MNTRTNRSAFLRPVSALAAAGAILVGLVAAAPSPSPAPRADVKLSNGSVWKGDVGAEIRATYARGGKDVAVEGTIVKIDSKFIVVEVTEDGKTARRTISTFDLRKIESLDAGASAPAGSPASGGTGAASKAAPGSKPASPAAAAKSEKAIPNILVLPLEGTVGIGTRHDEIELIGKEADKFGPGQIIVLEIDSPGGLVIEGDKIHETMSELKKRHRVVAWIKKAISAAAFTALHCDEIYFQSVGALGSITMFSGTKAIEGDELRAWLQKIGEVAEMGGRPAIVAQAMVTNPVLCSYDRDEEGNITWYDTLKGKYVLSDANSNLTLNASNALHCKFSGGTADTVEELAKLLQLSEWKEASDAGRKIHQNWQRTLKDCEAAKPRLLNDLQNPAGSDATAQLSARIKACTEILKWYDRCYPGMVYEAPNLPPEKKYFEDMLEQFKKDLGRIKKAERN